MQYDLDKLFIATIQPHRRGRTLRWHVGSNIKGIENVSTIVHSDTLFSALCHAWGRLFGQADLEAGLNRFRAGDAPFRLSSTFPFLPRSDSPRYFVPKPALPIPQSEDKRLFLKYAKSLREAEFIDLDTLLDWLDLRDADNPQAGEYEALYKQIQKSNEDYQEIFWAGTEMGIVTDRIGASSPNPFYRGSAIPQRFQLTHYAYYFLVYCHDVGYQERLDVLIDEVSRSGLGGERSIGFGQFTAGKLTPVPDVWRDLFRSPTNGSTSYLLLSLCYPTASELASMDMNATRYRLVSRKGWFDSPTGYSFKRRRCNLFGEGSYLSLDGQVLSGQLADVSPMVWEQTLRPQLGDNWHPIYRYGLAFSVPI